MSQKNGIQRLSFFIFLAAIVALPSCLEMAGVEKKTLPVCGNGILEDGEECDDGNTADGDGCSRTCRGGCVTDADCDDGLGCTEDRCDAVSQACAHDLMPAAAVCRPSAGPCDPEESCDGADPQCPDDGVLAEGDPCDDGDACTFLDRCDGAGLCTGIHGLSGGAQAAAGFRHTCALLEGGGVTCWGFNEYGQLGDGTTQGSSLPVDVQGLASGVIRVTAGEYHTCALMDTGRVKCWGMNTAGQLGDGTFASRSTPADVQELSEVESVAAGGWFTCALLQSGGIRCWGSGNQGQLGSGSLNWEPLPLDVVGLGSSAISLSAGPTHTCAVLDTGGVQCWGANWWGQIGDGTTEQRNTPTDVTGLSAPASAVALGGSHTCAILEGGSVQCWGTNHHGQLGDGTTDERHSPVTVSGLASRVEAIALGRHQSCALLETGSIQCWGEGLYGQLGYGSWLDSIAPVSVSGLASQASSLSVGWDHACAIVDSGGIQCWGRSGNGRLGDGSAQERRVPTDIPGLDSTIKADAGGMHLCVILDTGALHCWGKNPYGQLGNGTTQDSASPSEVTSLSSGVADISAGYNHSCAVLDTGGVRCWGKGENGELGEGAAVDRRTEPVDVVDLDSGVLSVSVGERHSCALMDTGQIKCWGLNWNGQLGDGTNTERTTPVDVVGLASGAAALSAGGWHTCALLDTGSVQCWGNNAEWQLGDGTEADSPAPVDVAGIAGNAVAIACGLLHCCAALGSGDALCWGANWSGQLGDGTQEARALPVEVAGLPSPVAAPAVGESHSCALLQGGGVMCWGANDEGQAGTGETGLFQLEPALAVGLSSGAAALTAGGSFSCALRTAGEPACWGTSGFGLFGEDGMDRSLPVGVACR